MRKPVLFLVSLLTSAALLLPYGASAQDKKLSLDELLDNVKAGRVNDRKQQKSREQSFGSDNKGQRAYVQALLSERQTLEAQSETLEQTFDENDKKITELREQLTQDLGGLKELLGTLQQTTGEAQIHFESSLVSSQLPGRDKMMAELTAKIGESNSLVSLDEIEGVWQLLLEEMIAQGKVTQFEAPVTQASGESSSTTVTRVGVFNAIANGRFLSYDPVIGLSELARQPQKRYLSQARALEAGGDALVAFSVDPTQGSLLSAMVDSPSIQERFNQGGVIGLIIAGIGCLALLIAIIKILALIFVETKVRGQISNIDNPRPNNPLGRIFNVYSEHGNSDVESMELRLGEAIMKETPKLNSWLTLLKIIAVVSPLLGLLGTVTGMIVTFDSINLFGTGDPKLMAGGISQALVTTVLGLCVAIPVVLLHTTASSRAKRVQEILEEQAAGMIAQHAESLEAPGRPDIHPIKK